MSLPNARPTVVVGELLVDIVRTADGRVAEHVGGSPANVAMGLARLGHDTSFATVVGRDDRGRRCVDQVSAAGVRLLDGAVSATHPTSTAAAELDTDGAATYRFDLYWDLPPVALPDGLGHLHTGSIAATLTPGDASVLDAVRSAATVGTVSYDPNARPSIMGDPDEARARVEEIVALSDVVKCSDEDLSWLYPDATVEEVLTRWGSLGTALTLVTLGGDGVRWHVSRTGEHGSAPATADRVVDTVGAGDSFMAGLLSGLLDAGLLGGTDARTRLRSAVAEDLRPALERGLRTSGITVTHTGAYAPTREEL